MMEVQRHKFLLARHKESKVKNSSSTHFMIKCEISNEVPDLLRSLFIKQYEPELYHQHQNKAEPHGVVKGIINTLMNLTEPSSLLAIMSFVCLSLLNVTASPALGGLIPIQALTGHVPDISHFLHFSFWEPVYNKVDENEPDHRFPSQSNEKQGHWVGFAGNKGDHLHGRYLLMKQTKS